MPRVLVSNRSGAVVIRAEEIGAISVEGGTAVSLPDGSVRIDPDRPSDEVRVRCAAGSDLVIGTGSGAVRVIGRFGDLHVTTKSGPVEIEEAAAIEVHSISGRVAVSRCDGHCHIVTVNGRIEVGAVESLAAASTAGKITAASVGWAKVRTVSGSVLLGSGAPPSVSVRSVSGSIEVALPRGTAPHAALKSVSGSIRNECASGTDGEVDALTISGRIRVSWA